MSVKDEIKNICDYKSNKLQEIQELKNQQNVAKKELSEYINNEISKIENAFNISSGDGDRKCKSYSCSINCISPCDSCHGYGMCEQCTYGYCGFVEKLIRKYSREELGSYKEKCPYALIAYIKNIKEDQ